MVREGRSRETQGGYVAESTNSMSWRELEGLAVTLDELLADLNTKPKAAGSACGRRLAVALSTLDSSAQAQFLRELWVRQT